MGSPRTFGHGSPPPDPIYEAYRASVKASAYVAPPRPVPVTAADLGIIDQNLDEKVGMDNPLDGTRLWDNS